MLDFLREVGKAGMLYMDELQDGRVAETGT